MPKVGFACFIMWNSHSVLAQDPPDDYNPFSVVDDGNYLRRGLPSNSGAQRSIPEERGCGADTLAWGNNEYEEVPGIQWAYIKNYCDNGLEISIWTDFTTTLFGSNSEARSQGREITSNDGIQHSDFNGDRVVSGYIEANARVEYSFSIDTDGTGIGTINGIEYDLQEGTLFLVATHGSTLEIRQVNYNLASISARDITLLATRHSEITKFFGEFHASY